MKLAIMKLAIDEMLEIIEKINVTGLKVSTEDLGTVYDDDTCGVRDDNDDSELYAEWEWTEEVTCEVMIARMKELFGPPHDKTHPFWWSLDGITVSCVASCFVVYCSYDKIVKREESTLDKIRMAGKLIKEAHNSCPKHYAKSALVDAIQNLNEASSRLEVF